MVRPYVGNAARPHSTCGHVLGSCSLATGAQTSGRHQFSARHWCIHARTHARACGPTASYRLLRPAHSAPPRGTCRAPATSLASASGGHDRYTVDMRTARQAGAGAGRCSAPWPPPRPPRPRATPLGLTLSQCGGCRDRRGTRERAACAGSLGRAERLTHPARLAAAMCSRCRLCLLVVVGCCVAVARQRACESGARRVAAQAGVAVVGGGLVCVCRGVCGPAPRRWLSRPTASRTRARATRRGRDPSIAREATRHGHPAFAKFANPLIATCSAAGLVAFP
jgi:hypothetical protein